jgi:hypothetical protein
MAGGGVGSGQDKVLISSTFRVEVHALASSLQRFGVSARGAQEFAQGNGVTTELDRRALASLFADALNQLRSR